jgi:hypothetical protein
MDATAGSLPMFANDLYRGEPSSPIVEPNGAADASRAGHAVRPPIGGNADRLSGIAKIKIIYPNVLWCTIQ